MGKLTAQFSKVIICFIAALIFQFLTKDLTAVRDYFLNQQLDTELKELSLILKSQQLSSPGLLKEKLNQIESNYKKYPRIGCQLVELYSQVGQISKAQLYLESMTAQLDNYSTDEQIFLLKFSQSFYVKFDFPVELVNAISDKIAEKS